MSNSNDMMDVMKKDIYDEYIRNDVKKIFDIDMYLAGINDILDNDTHARLFFMKYDIDFFREIKMKLEDFSNKGFRGNDKIYPHPMDQYAALAKTKDLSDGFEKTAKKLNEKHLLYIITMLAAKIDSLKLTIERMGNRHNFSLEKHL